MTDDTRHADGRWRAGQSGNPGGRPRFDSATRAKLYNAAPEVADRVIDLAKKGDLAAARLVLERVAPALRATQQEVDLPELRADGELLEQGRAVLAAIAEGRIAPDVGAGLLAAVGQLGALKTISELEQRILELEAAAAGGLV